MNVLKSTEHVKGPLDVWCQFSPLNNEIKVNCYQSIALINPLHSGGNYMFQPS
jgi:hypothetical protein